MEGVNLMKGTMVITPDGEGEIIEINSGTVRVRLEDGTVRDYDKEKLSDDSDAG